MAMHEFDHLSELEKVKQKQMKKLAITPLTRNID